MNKLTNSMKWRLFRSKAKNNQISQDVINSTVVDYIEGLGDQTNDLAKLVKEQQKIINMLKEEIAANKKAADDGFASVSMFINNSLLPYVNEKLGGKDPGSNEEKVRN